jgi:hypothetical protein
MERKTGARPEALVFRSQAMGGRKRPSGRNRPGNFRS